MADLLECLIQIKALGETLERVARLPEGVDAGAFLHRLGEAERLYARALLGTNADGPPETCLDSLTAGPALQEFVALRRANIAALDRCTAAQLSSPVDWPGRRSTTVADLVAIMLAHDTELLGAWRRGSPGRWARSRNPESGAPRPDPGKPT